MFVFMKNILPLRNTGNRNMKRTVKSLIYQGAELSLVADDLLVSALSVTGSTACAPEEFSGDFSFYLNTKDHNGIALKGGSVTAEAAGFFCATNNLTITNMSKELNYQSPACALLKVCTEGVLCSSVNEFYSTSNTNESNETFNPLNNFDW